MLARLGGLRRSALMSTMPPAPPPIAAPMRLARLKPATSALLICDIQERFRTAIHKFPAVVAGSRRMGEAAKLLGIPTIVTEQYPKGLGHTVGEFDKSAATIVEKTDFSMCVPQVVKVLKAHSSLTDVIICGIEAHVCVQQSTLDLIEMGYNVHLCVDAVSSSDSTGRAVGLHRCAGAGAYITSTESVLFELMRSKDHPNFKAISGLVKETRVGPEDALGF
jgi:nicotinamidase-related amidase